MKKTNLDSWICEAEGIAELTRSALEALQLRRLNELLAKEKRRGGFYSDLPESIASLNGLKSLPFTTSEQLVRFGSSMLLVSQSQVSRIITDSTSGTTGDRKAWCATAQNGNRKNLWRA